MQGQEEGAGLRNLYIWGLCLKRMRRSPALLDKQCQTE